MKIVQKTKKIFFLELRETSYKLQENSLRRHLSAIQFHLSSVFFEAKDATSNEGLKKK